MGGDCSQPALHALVVVGTQSNTLNPASPNLILFKAKEGYNGHS